MLSISLYKTVLEFFRYAHVNTRPYMWAWEHVGQNKPHGPTCMVTYMKKFMELCSPDTTLFKKNGSSLLPSILKRTMRLPWQQAGTYLAGVTYPTIHMFPGVSPAILLISAMPPPVAATQTGAQAHFAVLYLRK